MQKLLNKFITLPAAGLLTMGSVEANKANAFPVNSYGCDLGRNAFVQYELKKTRENYVACRPFVPNGKGYKFAGLNNLSSDVSRVSIETFVKEGNVSFFGNGRAELEPSLNLRSLNRRRHELPPERVNGAEVQYYVPEGGVARIETNMLDKEEYPRRKQILIGIPSN
jgi:hypothetical protein